MNAKLYVGNLPYTMTNADLEELFAQVGTVKSARVISDRDTGRSKGFGFIEMETSDEAQAAISEFNGTEISGRALKVNEANESAPRPRSGGFGGGGRGGDRGGDRGGNRRF